MSIESCLLYLGFHLTPTGSENDLAVGMHVVCPLHSLAGNFYVSLGINCEASQKCCTLQLVILLLQMLPHSYDLRSKPCQTIKHLIIATGSLPLAHNAGYSTSISSLNRDGLPCSSHAPTSPYLSKGFALQFLRYISTVSTL